MKKQLLFSLLLLHAAFFSIGQQTIVQWNFNSSTNFTVAANGTAPAPSTGAGTINLIGGVTATSAGGVDPIDGATSFNKALNTSSYPGLGIGEKTAGISISTSTIGFNSIHLKYYVQHSNSAANKVIAIYTDASGTHEISVYTTTTGGSFLPQIDIDLSAYPVFDNASNIQIKLVTDFGNGTNYIAANAPATSYGTNGTIRYDLITVTGNPIGCVNPATQQASGFRLLKTDNTSVQLTLNRGNGGGALVLCSATGIPSATPASGTNYTANIVYGSGNALGNAFAVYNTTASNPATQYFNITNLIAGTKYYLAAYEYSAQGYCYLTPAYVDSFYCNSTVLYPGDVQFVGYDNFAGASGRDAFVLVNLKEIKTGTTIQIVNSRFEAGAAANVRTNRWFAGSNNLSQNLDKITVTYLGTSLPSGSIFSFDHLPQSPGNIKINGVATTDFLITDNLTIGNLLSGSAAEQFFVTQGKFTAYSAGTNQYSLLDGHVLHGISYTNNWVDFAQACSNGGNNSDRESRIPPDIKCLNLFFPGASNYGYYQTGAPHSGQQGFLLTQIKNNSNWTSGAGTNGNDIASTTLATPFTILSQNTVANWNGTNNNWFDCNNWDNRYVPDSTTDATIPITSNNPVIDNTLAGEYGSQATTRSLNTDAPISLSGANADKLIVYDTLTINATGGIITANGSDTVFIRGVLRNNNTVGLQLSNNGWIGFTGNRLLKPIPVYLQNSGTTDVQGLILDNPPGIEISNGGFQSLQKLQLASGILSFTTANAFHYMGAGCTVSSPANYLGELNKGWQESFIDGKVYMYGNYNTTYIAPLGSKQQNVYEPIEFKPTLANSNNNLFTATYNPVTHPNVAAADVRTPPLHHISTKEYWTLNSTTPTVSAQLTLYYTPYSAVGGTGNDMQALQDLCIAQYWDSSAHTPRLWQTFGLAPYFTAGPNINYGKVTCDMAATDLLPSNGFFTLGTKSIHNTLPVQIIIWQAALQNNRTQLHWKLANETDITFYTVEKSIDGKKFQTLQTTFANGIKSYTAYDNQLADGWNYYRLKVVDAYGKVIYSTIEKVWNKTNFTLSVFPNPATDVLYINLPSGATTGFINIYAADGKKIIVQQTAGTNFLKLNVAQLTSGIYLLEYKSGSKNWQQKLLIK